MVGSAPCSFTKESIQCLRLKAVGRDFAGKKKCAATKKTVFEALVSLVKATPRTAPAEALTPTNGNDVPPTTVSPIDCFRDLLELDGVDLVGPEDQTMSAKVIPEPDPNDEEKSEVINHFCTEFPENA
jgi:hypothetical protein